jgi:hypothetical protein
MYIGNNQVDCHATSHLGANWTLGGADDYFFIHINLHDSIVPNAPHNTLPATNTSVANLTPTLKADAFSCGAIGSTQVASEWEIFKAGTLVYDTGIDTTDMLALQASPPAHSRTRQQLHLASPLRRQPRRLEQLLHGDRLLNVAVPEPSCGSSPVAACCYQHTAAGDALGRVRDMNSLAPNPVWRLYWPRWVRGAPSAPGSQAADEGSGRDLAAPRTI